MKPKNEKKQNREIQSSVDTFTNECAKGCSTHGENERNEVKNTEYNKREYNVNKKLTMKRARNDAKVKWNKFVDNNPLSDDDDDDEKEVE